MEDAQQIKVNIINRNYPPAKGITGESAADLAEFLSSQGMGVNIITVGNSQYGGGGGISYTTGNVVGVRTFYNGKNKFLRLLSSLVEGYKLVRKAISLNADWTIVMTDPPLLNYFAARLLKQRHKWILWSMDIYPEAFLAAELLSRKNIFITRIQKTLRNYPPSAVIALGPVQKEFLRRNYYPHSDYFELPCGIFSLTAGISKTPTWKTDLTKIYLGYCGNIGEAHSVSFIKEIIRQFDRSRYILVLSVYGAKAIELYKFAEKYDGILFINSVSRDDLPHIDIHIATLLEKWVNVCVPSKAVSSACSGAAFLYHGIPDSDNWELLKEAGWIISPKEDLKISLANFFSHLHCPDIIEKKARARFIGKKLLATQTNTYSNIARKIKGNF